MKQEKRESSSTFPLSEWIQWEGSTLSLSTAQDCEQGPGEVIHPSNAHVDELQWLF